MLLEKELEFATEQVFSLHLWQKEPRYNKEPTLFHCCEVGLLLFQNHN